VLKRITERRSRLHIADISLLVAIGQPLNGRCQAVRRFARWSDITFVLPERVYEELTVDDPEIKTPPVDGLHVQSEVLRAADER
jgi:hypothetical protein